MTTFFSRKKRTCQDLDVLNKIKTIFFAKNGYHLANDYNALKNISDLFNEYEKHA